jgi:hypothetical protein
MKGLRYFAFLLYDYESMLILLEKAPPGRLPSVNPKTVKLFFKWKVYPSGTALLDDNNNPVLDYEGNPMECVGSWAAPDNLAQFKSALSLVHVSRGQDGPYSEACPDCVSGLAAAENPQQYLGCDFHHPSRRITRQGNPMTYQLLFYESGLCGKGKLHSERRFSNYSF